MRPPLLLAVCVLSLSVGCVTQGKYDDAVRSANDAQAQLKRVSAEDAAKSAELQAKLDEETALNKQMNDARDQLGQKADALLAEKGSLASALDQSRARLDELRRAQAATEARARLFHDLALKLKSMIDAGQLGIVLREGRMVLQLPNDVLFASGQVDIRPQGRTALAQVAGVLATLADRRFQVAGHTDDVPIDTDRFPSNWELSTARALEVTRFLIGHGLKSTNVSAAGYAEFDPVASNADPHGRAKNRRIEITLQPNIDEMVAVPALQ
ncbi:MAG: OmpA family protein [Polyangiaceae bacterium]